MKRSVRSVYVKVIKNKMLFCLVTIFSVLIIIYLNNRNSYYSFFIEFDNANGIDKGTPIRMRGIQIGSIQSLRVKPYCVLALAQINSKNILIPKKSIFETSQTGLLNEAIVDIIPVSPLELCEQFSNPLSNNCQDSEIICHKMYVTGDRGLNYDDLVRSTTRISQRFDDPRFFNLFYVFLQNGIEMTDATLELIIDIRDITAIAYVYLQQFLVNSLF